MHCRGGGRWCGGYQNSFEVCQFRVLNVGILGIMLGLGLPWPKWPRIIKSCSDRLIPRAPLLGGSGLLEDILIDVLIIPMRFGVWALHLTRTPLIWAAWNGHEGVVKCYSHGTTSIPTRQISSVKHHSVMLLRIGTGWW